MTPGEVYSIALVKLALAHIVGGYFDPPMIAEVGKAVVAHDIAVVEGDADN